MTITESIEKIKFQSKLNKIQLMLIKIWKVPKKIKLFINVMIIISNFCFYIKRKKLNKKFKVNNNKINLPLLKQHEDTINNK